MSMLIEDAETPWTALKGVRSVKVSPHENAVRGEVEVPGSKSFSNRALILAAMAEGTSVLDGVLRADDTYWCIDALKRLGAVISVDANRVKVTGIGRTRPHSGPVHVGTGGTVARFLPPFLVAGDAGQWRLTASKQMSGRPVAPMLDVLRAGGARITFHAAEGCYPFTMHGASFAGGAHTMAGNVSSQFISGLLMGGAQAPEGLDLTVSSEIVQSDYVRITLDMMAHFGVEVEANDGFDRFAVPHANYTAKDLVVEADASTATYFAALAAVTGGDVTLTNIGAGTRQPDYGFVDILERMGCTIERGKRETRVKSNGPLKGGFDVDMKPLSDATLTLAVLAVFADGPISMHGIEHIRHHESDRISAICQELEKVGIETEERQDGLTVYPGTPRFATVDPHEDHRMAMALAVLGAAGAGIEISEPGCISKTCPSFFDEIGKLGVETSHAAR